MASQRPKVRSLRRLSASSRARREKRAAAKRRLTYLGSAAGVAIVLAAPLSIAAFMNMGSSVPGIEAAKSFLAMMTDRSPGDRTKAELTKTKQAKLPDVPEQRALGKITKPEPPKEFIEAIAPTVAKPVEEFAPGACRAWTAPRHAAAGRWRRDHHSAASRRRVAVVELRQVVERPRRSSLPRTRRRHRKSRRRKTRRQSSRLSFLSRAPGRLCCSASVSPDW